MSRIESEMTEGMDMSENYRLPFRMTEEITNLIVESEFLDRRRIFGR